MNQSLQLTLALGVFAAGVGAYVTLVPKDKPGLEARDTVETKPRAENRTKAPTPAPKPEREGVDTSEMVSHSDLMLSVLDDEPWTLPQFADTDEIAKLVKALKDKAAQSDIQAIVRLGKLHLHGIGMPKDGDKWEQLTRKAADLGHPASQFDVAMFVIRDTDPRKNDGKKYAPGTRPAEHFGMHPDAVAWLEKAIAGGDAAAMTYLGGYYLREKKFAKAVPLLEQGAAKEAVGCAKWSLAQMYLEGKAVPRDLDKVYELLLASRGCANVGSEAVELYTEGKLAPKDYGKAYTILANEDFTPFKIQMAMLLAKGGPGLAKDTERALAILREAESNGYDVKDELRKVERLAH